MYVSDTMGLGVKCHRKWIEIVSFQLRKIATVDFDEGQTLQDELLFENGGNIYSASSHHAILD